MELCLGMLGWAPRDFWDATMHEILAAAAGLRKFHGDATPGHMTRARLQEILDQESRSKAGHS